MERCVSCSIVFDLKNCIFCSRYHNLYCDQCCESLIYEKFEGDKNNGNIYNEFIKRLNSKALEIFTIKIKDRNYMKLFLTREQFVK